MDQGTTIGIIGVIVVVVMIAISVIKRGRTANEQLPTDAQRTEMLRKRLKETAATITGFPAIIASLMFIGGIAVLCIANGAVHEIEGMLAFSFGLLILTVMQGALGIVAAIHRLRHTVEDQTAVIVSAAASAPIESDSPPGPAAPASTFQERMHALAKEGPIVRPLPDLESDIKGRR